MLFLNPLIKLLESLSRLPGLTFMDQFATKLKLASGEVRDRKDRADEYKSRVQDTGSSLKGVSGGDKRAAKAEARAEARGGGGAGGRPGRPQSGGQSSRLRGNQGGFGQPTGGGQSRARPTQGEFRGDNPGMNPNTPPPADRLRKRDRRIK